MISDRRTISFVATVLSIPPILLVAAAVGRLLPPAPHVPAVVAANDQRADAMHGQSTTADRDNWGGVELPLADPQTARAR